MVETLTLVNTRLVLVLGAIAIVVVLLFVTGWADDRADPGSSGRVQVTR
jgi:hypothetical protein